MSSVICGCATNFPENGVYRTENEYPVREANITPEIICLRYVNLPTYADLSYTKTSGRKIGPLYDIGDLEKRRPYFFHALSSNRLSVVRSPAPPFLSTTNIFYYIEQSGSGALREKRGRAKQDQ